VRREAPKGWKEAAGVAPIYKDIFLLFSFPEFLFFNLDRNQTVKLGFHHNWRGKTWAIFGAGFGKINTLIQSTAMIIPGSGHDRFFCILLPPISFKCIPRSSFLPMTVPVGLWVFSMCRVS